MTLQQIITWIFGNLEFVIIGLVVLSTVFNFLSGAGKQVREAQARGGREREMQRRSGELSREAPEANPNTQSYQGYLQRTNEAPATINRTPPAPSVVVQRPSSDPQRGDLRAEILEALGMKNAPMPPIGAPQDPQAELRRKLAEKMGRSSSAPATSSAPARSVPPKPTPRPVPRPVFKPIESQIEIYLDQSRPENLDRDSVPDSFGHSKRRPHFDLPQNDPRDEGSVAYKGEGGVAVILKPDAVNEVRGIGTAASAAANSASLARRLIDPRNAAQGVIWSEILGQPRSRRGR